MSDVIAFYRVVRQTVLLEVWRMAVRGTLLNGMNLFIRMNIGAFDGQGKVTDYAKLHFATGVLPGCDRLQARYDIGAKKVDIHWENYSVMDPGCAENEVVVVIVFADDSFRIFFPGEQSGRRRDKDVSICLPEECPDPCEVYCFFAQEDRQRYSADAHVHLDD